MMQYKPNGRVSQKGRPGNYYWLTSPRNPKSGLACLSLGWPLHQDSFRHFPMIPSLPNLPWTWEMEGLKRKAGGP